MGIKAGGSLVMLYSVALYSLGLSRLHAFYHRYRAVPCPGSVRISGVYITGRQTILDASRQDTVVR